MVYQQVDFDRKANVWCIICKPRQGFEFREDLEMWYSSNRRVQKNDACWAFMRRRRGIAKR